MADKTNKKKRIAWWTVLLAWAGVMLLGGTAICTVLYKYLDVYEQTRPEAVMDRLIEKTTTDELIRTAEENIPFVLTKYESAPALYEEYISGVDYEKPLTYRLDSGSEDGHTYIVRSGAYNICNVKLEEDGDPVGFGRHKWKIASIEAADVTKVIKSIRVSVDVLPGEEDGFTLNDLKVGEDFLSEEVVDITDESNSIVERSMENPPKFHRITIGPLYTGVSVKNADGSMLSVAKEEDGVLYFRASEPQYKRIIEAPSDMEVFVNGVLLTKEMSAKTDDGLFEGLENYTHGSAYQTVTYDIEPLYLEPEVTADGNVIQVSEDRVMVFHDDGEAEDGELYAAAQDFFRAYMNYSSYSYNGGSYGNLLSKILPGTDLYYYVANSKAAMIWASATKTEYRNLSYDNFHRMGEDCFVCMISYDADMTANSWYERYSYELKNSYEVVFVRQNERWYAAGMSVLNGE